MSSDKRTYENPLETRYASKEMREIFSADHRYRGWRKLWLALAKAERELGLPITGEQIQEIEAHLDDIDYDAVAEKERKLRHDVMAHLITLGELCPKAKPILHLGATSCYVTDNEDLLLIREALSRILTLSVNVVGALADLARRLRDLPVLAFTHLQVAQPTTFGKRACLWIQDLLLDVVRLEQEIEGLRFRGVKGTTGTQASFLELFEGDDDKVRRLDELVAADLGFPRTLPVTGQTYPRKVDYSVLSALSGIAQSAHKFANDIRLLMHMEEVSEPFEKAQVGSSAMPYKRNPMRSERMTALSRYLISLPVNAAQTAAEQWFERTLDDSANRRIVLPQAFLAADGVLQLYLDVARGLTVNEDVIARNLARELPFLATERILMRAVKLGGDRQDLHERIRVHSLAAREALHRGAEGELTSRLASDPAFSSVRDELSDLLDPKETVGRAPQQVTEFLEAHVEPLLERYADRLGAKSRVVV